MEEQWKDIIGYEGLYQISNYGRVKSLNYHRSGKEQILKPHLWGKKKYFIIGLYKDGKCHQITIHRLVAQSFLDNPKNLPCVNHKDENPQNNFIWVNENGSVDLDKSNLEWCDIAYNNNYGTRIERISKANINNQKNSKEINQYFFDDSNPLKKLRTWVSEKDLIKTWTSARQIQRELGYNQQVISQCCLGKRKTAYGFIWRFKNDEE